MDGGERLCAQAGAGEGTSERMCGVAAIARSHPSGAEQVIDVAERVLRGGSTAPAATLGREGRRLAQRHGAVG
eukprot:COSAG06_NODE_14166_length_1182_cov_3141.701754_1_plen_73_part_00